MDQLGENCGSTDPTIACAQRTNSVDDDGNGYVDDYRGWDFVNDDNNPFDDNSHGTHVSGTIGAVGNNGVGVVGVNWNVKIMALKFLNASGYGSTADAVSATIYAANMGASVSNNSWGGGGFDQSLLDAIEYGASHGLLFVAAAGNNASNNDSVPFYPASYNSDVIASIAATDHNDARSSFSNFGATTVDLGAPGTSILSTIPDNGYALFTGTSMATPHVSGAAALLKAHFPSATAYGLKALLMRSVDPKPSMQGITVTGGRLNVFNAVSCSNAPKTVLLTPLNGFSVHDGAAGRHPYVRRQLCVARGSRQCQRERERHAGHDDRREPGQRPLQRHVYADQRRAARRHCHGDDQRELGRRDGVGYRFRRQLRAVHLPGRERRLHRCDGRHAAPAAVDDGFTPVNLPFSFPYFASTHTQAFVSSNGFLTLGSSSGANIPNNVTIPTAGNPNGVVAPFWDDLNPSSAAASIRW